MKNKGISKLSYKLSLGVLIIALLICVASSLVGYFQYKSVIQKQYNDTAYQIAGVAKDFINIETLTDYVNKAKGYLSGEFDKTEIDEIVQSQEYTDIAKQIDELRYNMGANDVFIFYVDVETLNAYNGNKEGWNPLVYIFDSYTVPEYSYVIGNTGPFNPKYIDEINELVSTGEIVDNYFISDGEYGYNTTAILPIKDSSGNLIALSAVDIPMLTIKSALRNYLINNIFIIVLVVLILNVCFLFYLTKSVINPINIISKEADVFTKNTDKISEELPKINTKDEIQNLSESIVKMEIDINEYIKNITRITAEKERIGAELDVATKIQSSMLPTSFPPFSEKGAFAIYATMTPAKEVGGDFYDFFMVDNNHLAVVVADVSGKGIPAALFMVIGKTLIKDHTTSGGNLGEIFSVVNNMLCDSNSEGLFITAFEGVLDLTTGKFDYVNAGHNPPLIKKKNGEYEYFKMRPGFVLAGMEDVRYSAHTMQLDPGDELFIYTDGNTEATNSNNELYGEERLCSILNAQKYDNPKEVCIEVKKDIDKFVADAPQFDDITMLSLKYNGGNYGINT